MHKLRSSRLHPWKRLPVVRLRSTGPNEKRDPEEQFNFLFTHAAGLPVLRTLGASNRIIRLSLLAEYAALGLIAGVVAAAAAQALGWSLAQRVFELPYEFRLTLWLAGALGGAVLVSLLGWFSLRRTLATPPRQVLAANT